MCGITGVKSDYALLKSVQIAIEQEHRGKSSTGLAFIYNSNNIGIIKDIIAPREFYNKYKVLLEYNLDIAICHNRQPSVGRVTYENAHPFLACDSSFSLIHNGTAIFQHINGKIRKLLQLNNHKIYGQTDSELLTHILELYINKYNDKITALEEFAIEWLGGAIIILTEDKEIYGIKDDLYPLNCMVTNKGIYLASEIRAIENTIKRYNEKIEEKFSLEPYKAIRIKDYTYEYHGKKIENEYAVITYYRYNPYNNFYFNNRYNDIQIVNKRKRKFKKKKKGKKSFFEDFFNY